MSPTSLVMGSDTERLVAASQERPEEEAVRSTRLPGMHGGHDVLHGVVIAIALFATLILYAIHS